MGEISYPQAFPLKEMGVGIDKILPIALGLRALPNSKISRKTVAFADRIPTVF